MDTKYFDLTPEYLTSLTALDKVHDHVREGMFFRLRRHEGPDRSDYNDRPADEPDEGTERKADELPGSAQEPTHHSPCHSWEGLQRGEAGSYFPDWVDRCVSGSGPQPAGKGAWLAAPYRPFVSTRYESRTGCFSTRPTVLPASAGWVNFGSPGRFAGRPSTHLK